MKHKKVLGTNDGTASLVGGQHWDDDHAYGLKDMPLVGILSWSHTMGNNYVDGSALMGLLARPDIIFISNEMTCTVNMSPVPVAVGRTANLQAVLADTGAIVPAGYKMNLWNSADGDIAIRWLNSAGDIVAAPADSRPTILLYALIT